MLESSRSSPRRRIALALLLAVGCADAAPRRPDIVVVLLDTVRPDRLGVYDASLDTAPFLTGLAQRSTVFLDAVSTSGWTAPATASLFTSLHPLRHGVTLGMVIHERRQKQRPGGGTVIELNRIPAEVATLPQVLADLGYRCFGVTTNPNIGPEVGFERGFDRFERIERIERRPRDRDTDLEVVGSTGWRWGNAEEVQSVVAAWREEIAASRPYFLYLHFNDAHEPYQVRRPWFAAPQDRTGRAEAAYVSEIGYLDDVLGRLYRELGLERDAILVVVSDHGEAFGEHGRRYHHRGLYRELNQIVLMVSAPSLGIEARLAPERVSILSVLPTLLDLLGEPVPPDLDGWSLAPLLLDDPERGALERRLRERVLIAHREEMEVDAPPTWAVMKGSWTLIREGGRSELYDVASDPGQRSDLAMRHPEIRSDLEEALADFRSATEGADSERVEVELDARTVEGLEALGYIVEDSPGDRTSGQRRED
jgi:arylsulfatase A-like enzyme